VHMPLLVHHFMCLTQHQLSNPKYATNTIAPNLLKQQYFPKYVQLLNSSII